MERSDVRLGGGLQAMSSAAHIKTVRPHSCATSCFSSTVCFQLPFGAVRSVHSFLRASFSLWYLLVRSSWSFPRTVSMITLLLRQKRRQVQLRRAFTCFSDWLVETSLRLGRRPQPFLICFKLWALCSMSVPCVKDWLQLEIQRAGILSWCRPC